MIGKPLNGTGKGGTNSLSNDRGGSGIELRISDKGRTSQFKDVERNTCKWSEGEDRNAAEKG